MRNLFVKFILHCSVVMIPLSDSSLWKELKFRKIPANRVQYTKDGIVVDVNKSASPLVYNFNGVKRIKSVEADLEIAGNPRFDKKEWAEFEEDSVFRLGLILEGSKKMDGFSSIFAPKWVRSLFEMASKNSGLDKIHFLNVTQNEKLINKTRQHPKSELILEENVIIARPQQKTIKIIKTFDKPLSVAGLWISIDGDESNSNFVTRIQSIKIDKAP